MRPDPHTPSQTRQVTLPSGRTIEIVYLDEPPIPELLTAEDPGASVLDERAAHLAEVAHDLTLCGACGCAFVQPVDWDEAGPRHWRLELRCPNCERHGTVVVEDEVVDHYDLELERGAATLARALHETVERNVEDEVARFAAALDSGLVLPEDF
jgi:hypothetical protein